MLNANAKVHLIHGMYSHFQRVEHERKEGKFASHRWNAFAPCRSLNVLITQSYLSYNSRKTARNGTVRYSTMITVASAFCYRSVQTFTPCNGRATQTERKLFLTPTVAMPANPRATGLRVEICYFQSTSWPYHVTITHHDKRATCLKSHMVRTPTTANMQSYGQ